MRLVGYCLLTYIWVVKIDLRGQGEDGVIVVHSVGVPLWMALEATVDADLWLVGVDGSHDDGGSGAEQKHVLYY